MEEENNTLTGIIEVINRQKQKAKLFGYRITGVTMSKETYERCMVLFERQARSSLQDVNEIMGLPIKVVERVRGIFDFIIHNNNPNGENNIHAYSHVW